MERIDTIIVGGGQAGLVTSYHLNERGCEHLVLEAAPRPADVWRSQRWDSFTMVTPNWSFRLPGVANDGVDPDGFMSRQEIVAAFDGYVDRFRLPIRCNTRVDAIEPLDGGGYRVRTPDRDFSAQNVVIATGFFQQPKPHPASADIAPGIHQIHSSQYRNPGSLPAGAVLVVGSAQSGCQIAEELYQSGRTVYLATGTAGRVPRRYRGRDVIAWLDDLGIFDELPEQLPPPMSKFGGIPQLSGKNGGHTLNLHQFAHDGVTLLGHLRGAAGDRIMLAPDLHENLAIVDGFEQTVVQGIDGYIAANGLDAPLEDLPQLRAGFDQPAIEELDLKAAGVTTVIWAMGFTFDYSLVKLPVRDRDGFPIQTNGVATYPGLYFVGMPWMPSERSGFLIGVGEFAGRIADHIAASTSRHLTPAAVRA